MLFAAGIGIIQLNSGLGHMFGLPPALVLQAGLAVVTVLRSVLSIRLNRCRFDWDLYRTRPTGTAERHPRHPTSGVIASGSCVEPAT